jgi:hypothetical protein
MNLPKLETEVGFIVRLAASSRGRLYCRWVAIASRYGASARTEKMVASRRSRVKQIEFPSVLRINPEQDSRKPLWESLWPEISVRGLQVDSKRQARDWGG